MADSAAASQSVCSACGELLNMRGDCIACLLRGHDDIGLRRLRLEASISLGDAYIALAAVDTNVASTDRRSACDMYQRSSEIMQELQGRRTVAADEMTDMAERGHKIAECDKVSP